MSGFFDEFNRFYGSSSTGSEPARLNKRYCLMIEANKAYFPGARVLDLGSHDGRWSFAVSKAGALHVTGVEPRAHLVRNARDTFAHYGIPNDRYSFIETDAFEFLSECRSEYDVVLCLGFLYHTWRHVDLLRSISALSPSAIIIDTQITPSLDSKLAVIEYFAEVIEQEGNAVADASTRNGRVVVARPSKENLALLLQHFGYRLSEIPVNRFLRDPEGIADYCEGSRCTFVAIPC